jgi:hypothetical protein
MLLGSFGQNETRRARLILTFHSCIGFVWLKHTQAQAQVNLSFMAVVLFGENPPAPASPFFLSIVATKGPSR